MGSTADPASRAGHSHVEQDCVAQEDSESNRQGGKPLVSHGADVDGSHVHCRGCACVGRLDSAAAAPKKQQVLQAPACLTLPPTRLSPTKHRKHVITASPSRAWAFVKPPDTAEGGGTLL